MNQYASSFVNGFRDCPKFIMDLAKAINEEAGAISFYDKLMQLAPNQKQKTWIEHAKNDETKHLNAFTVLYLGLTCQNPVVQPKKYTFTTYKAGVALAIERELEATELYRDMYLATIIPEIRDIFFEAMTDEITHSVRFTHIYSLL